ncbi:hypothetical protein BASA61_008002 [Batrachochytrium salamandrivorans]|nr:hypothetical protein BASA61_008002 [Batrachochytrium salamandrivorans]KAH9268900.1 hypothetical protein BASA83_009033 [Batrachochytrium salamandrivorans]KAJ1330347.1 hypothetical protein BSLG_009481 [Batrachochytrium salamandrivorans]
MVRLTLGLALLALVSSTQAVCDIKVPANPLSAKGLATPYEVTGCDQIDAGKASFVQGAVYDPATNTISIYNPLIINSGSEPATAPVVPKLPKGAVVGLWFGSNSNAIHLTGPGLASGRCVNGLGKSDFGQFAACNGDRFFAAAANVNVPKPGTAKNGLDCPTVRDFSVVDQDQSDNVATTYIVASNGLMAQNTAANREKLGTNIVSNGSDNVLLVKILTAIGCKPFVAPDLADPGSFVPALPLNELQAGKFQKAPVALVPIGDPMTLVNGKPSIKKTTLYRLQVNQPVATAKNDGTVAYCKNLLKIAPARLLKDKSLTIKAASLDPAVGDTLFTFLAARLDTSFGPQGLDCVTLLNIDSPVITTKNSDGVVTNAKFNLKPKTRKPAPKKPKAPTPRKPKTPKRRRRRPSPRKPRAPKRRRRRPSPKNLSPKNLSSYGPLVQA